MSVDYLSIGNALVLIITLTILGFALYRAISFERVLLGGIYKSRAKWTAVFLVSIAFLLVDASGIVPYLSSDNGNTGFIVLALALPLFVNGSVRAAQETDFFHRDTLYWRALWKATILVPSGLIAIAVVVILVTGALPGSSSPWWVSPLSTLYFFELIIASIYGTATIILAARRTQDQTMRRFVRMLGLSLLGLVLFFTVWIPIDYFAPGVGDFLSEFGFVMAAYYLYRAVMSLSPLGKVEKLEGTTEASGLPSTA